MEEDQLDPRKKYAIQKRKCDNLSEYQKLHREDCKGEIKEYVIRPIPVRPKPKPTPKPIPIKPTPVPVKPKSYDFKVPEGYNYDVGDPANIPAIIGYSVAGAGATALLARRGLRAMPDRSYQRVRIAPEAENGIELRPIDELSFRGGEEGELDEPVRPLDTNGNIQETMLSGDPEAVEETEGITRMVGRLRSTSFMTSAKPEGDVRLGLRRRLTARGAFEEVPTSEPVDIEMSDLRAPPTLTDIPLEEETFVPKTLNVGAMLRARAVKLAKPTISTTDVSTPSQSAIELAEVTSQREAVASELDTLVAQASAERASIAGATQRISTLSSEMTTGTELTSIESDLATVSTEIDSGAGVLAQGRLPPPSALTAEGGEVEPETGGAGDVAPDIGDEVGGDLIKQGVKVDAGMGGPEDVVGDAISAGVMSLGAVAGIIGTLFQKEPNRFQNLGGTRVLSADGTQKLYDTIVKQQDNYLPNEPTYNALQTIKDQINDAQNSNRQVYTYKDSQGNSQIAYQLTKAQLATAIKTYQTNPNAYKGVNPTKLSMMGLNPNMSYGSEGAVDTPIGYLPKQSAIYVDGKRQIWNPATAGGNWSSFYLGEDPVATFSSNEDIDNNAVPTQSTSNSLNQDYVTKATAVINTVKNLQVKNYLNYQLNLWKYNNGLLSTKPAPVTKPVGVDVLSASKQITTLQASLQQQQTLLSATEASITNKQSIQTNLNNKVKQLSNAPQTTTQVESTTQQINNFRTQAQQYNRRLAQSLDNAEGVQSAINIQYARATNRPLDAPVGKYLTSSQIQNFNKTLTTNQITSNGVSPIKTLAPTGITTDSNGSPVISSGTQQNTLQTLPASNPTPSVPSVPSVPSN